MVLETNIFDSPCFGNQMDLRFPVSEIFSDDVSKSTAFLLPDDASPVLSEVDFGSDNENQPLKSVEILTIEQLSIIIDILIDDTINRKSKIAENKLNILEKELSQVVDFEHVQLFAKVTSTLFLVNREYSKAQKIIRRGVYDEKYHPILQFLYETAESLKRKKSFYNWEYVAFPKSIDPICDNGLSRSMNEYLENKFISISKAGMKRSYLESYSKQTGLSVDTLREYFEKLKRERHQKKTSIQYNDHDFIPLDSASNGFSLEQ